MASKTDKEKLPILRPTPLTWVYLAFALAVIVLGIWGFVSAGAP